MRPLQVTVGGPEGIDILALAKAIAAAYRPQGRTVRVRIGEGPVIDGLLPGMVYVEELDEPPAYNRGGPVTNPKQFTVGEKGPEIIVPPC